MIIHGAYLMLKKIVCFTKIFPNSRIMVWGLILATAAGLGKCSLLTLQNPIYPEIAVSELAVKSVDSCTYTVLDCSCRN